MAFQQQKIEAAVKQILEAIGEDPEREGLIDTPKRVAKMYGEVFSSLNEPEFDDYTLFASGNDDDMVVVKDIQFYSMCEHHLLPFFGKVHIAYVPEGDKVLGLSKLPRLVDYCTKRPSVQENLTVLIADQLVKHVPVKGVAVSIEAEHMCMTMRGVKTPHSSTKTFHYTGIFKEDREWKRDFLAAINN
ncbi:GTP cyclohydrolase I FolE [Enterococcus pallens]|uniref:GTP cyclohydrolase 1 n=1 Tax=Enterococcus pallens ATCC BAA-351 TaxID=1158607 RepID=R2PVR5_9ENTE|nr:GTP cyclohydrolase I FolE [Enterococcus pallens]EOH87303.1 GTP cyclohydrolase 1 [Enterococcus pallens ATCC BAA-351]EOU18245.1 GTP cyclohydrolase 1 [Enterococcus pallens ATCC BAA-351]OJG77067.1 GTP cyclohydrolase 1 [Enterococcus pallens]